MGFWGVTIHVRKTLLTIGGVGGQGAIIGKWLAMS